MQNRDKNYLFLIAAHLLIGVLIYVIPVFAKVYGYAIILVGILFVIKKRNKNNEVLYASAYIVGSEVLLRMTDGNPVYEFSKYGVMIFIIIGIFYSGFSKYSVPYWIYILLLVPGILIATHELNLQTEIRKTIAFNIAGPICLGLASMYTYNRKISYEEVNNILLMIGLPVVSCAMYLMLYTPNIREVLTGTGSNTELSGGFGPNQVSTVLGLGMFVFFSRILLVSRSKLIFIANLVVALMISYRGLVTFSRGGMLTGLIMIIFLLYFIYINSKSQGKLKLFYFFGFLLVVFLVVWSYTSFQTDGLIEKRYANQDAKGRVKESQLTGREDIAAQEFDIFLDHPFFGAGVARATEIRTGINGFRSLSHNEISRLMSEHGALGILALLLLFITPMILYLDNKQNIYIFCFLFFWLLTINHAAMRIAAPAFVYSLALLKVQFNED
jgi:O-Antigen ligase